jgi:uracil-DNA glycosylase
MCDGPRPPGFGSPVTALPVDNEPTPFWDGNPEQVTELFTRWRDNHFDPRWGTVAPSSLNGPTGRELDRRWLNPLGYDRAGAFITDCLTTARASNGVAQRLADRYAPVVEALGAPRADLAPHPSEDQIVDEALSEHTNRLSAQILAAHPALIVTLGNAAARVLAGLGGQTGRGFALTPATYGRERNIVLGQRTFRWQALVHPATPKAWADRHSTWTQTR